VTLELTLSHLISVLAVLVAFLSLLRSRARDAAQDTSAMSTHLDERLRALEHHQVVAEEFMRMRYPVPERLTRIETQLEHQRELLALLRDDMPKVLRDMLEDTHAHPGSR
jgi:hypothetical protein